MHNSDAAAKLLGMVIAAVAAVFCARLAVVNPVTNGCAYLVFGTIVVLYASLFVYLGVQLAASLRVLSRELSAPINRVPAVPVSRVSSFKPAQHKRA
jgi:uncharacterized membrane protein